MQQIVIEANYAYSGKAASATATAFIEELLTEETDMHTTALKFS
jgi:hypothetical protein